MVYYQLCNKKSRSEPEGVTYLETYDNLSRQHQEDFRKNPWPFPPRVSTLVNLRFFGLSSRGLGLHLQQLREVWGPKNGINNQNTNQLLLGGGFKYFLFSPLPGEMIQFD